MELGQRFVLVWTLIVSCAVVFTNGDIIGSPGDIRQGYRLLQAPAEVDTNTEEPKSPRRYKANNIIVQPVQGVDSNVADRQTDPSQAPRPAKDEGIESDDSKSKAKGTIASDRVTKVSSPRVGPAKNPGEQKVNTQDPKSVNPPKNMAVQPTGERKPKHVSPQSIPRNNVVVQPIYEQANPRLGNPRSDPSTNYGIPLGSNIAVQPNYQQQFTAGNVQSTPMKKTQPRYGFYVARAEPSPPSHDAVSSGPVGNFQSSNRPLKPYHVVALQRGWSQDSYYSNPGSNFPVRTIAVQEPQYEQNSWVGIPVQPIAPHVQSVYAQSSNLGIPQMEVSKDVVIGPGYGQGYWDGMARSNSFGNLPVQPVYEGAFSHPGYEPTRTIAIQPSGYAQDSALGILKFNPPVNAEVQPKYEPSSRAGIPQPSPPTSPPGQSGIELNHQVTKPRTNPIANVPAQPSNEPDPKARLSPGYPTINISFLRGYDPPDLRAEQPQSIPAGSAAQPTPNPAVQPTQETLYPKEGIPQPEAPKESGSSSVPSQNDPAQRFPVEFLENPELWEGSPPLVASNTQGYVPIHSELPPQPPTNPAVQPTRGNLRAEVPQPVAPYEFGKGFVPNQKAPFFFPTDILEKPEHQQASPLVGSAQWYVPINRELPAPPPANPAVQPAPGNLNSKAEISQPVAPHESGTGFVPNQKVPYFFPTDIQEKPEHQQASPLVGSAQWYVPSSHRESQAARNIALQSGHAKPILKVIATETNPPREVLVQSGYGQLHCHLKFVPQGNFALSVPKDSTLESEIQRNKDLHQLVVSQLHSVQQQPHVPHPQGAHYGKPGLFASQSSGQIPFGGKGSKKKKNGFGTAPLFLRSSNLAQCTGRSQYPRSLDTESGPNSGHGDPLWNYPQASSIGRKNISEAVNSIIPKVNATLNSFLNSTLNGIRPLGNSTNLIAGITTGIVDAARTLENKVSDVISPILGSQINGDPQKNPNNSQSPQASNSNVSRNGYPGPYDVKQLANNQGPARFPTMNNPHDMAKFVNEYGRNVMNVLPSTFNSAIDDSNAYLKGFYDNLKGYVH